MTVPDPGEPAPASDPQTARVLYALQLLHVHGPAMAADVLDAANAAAWLSPAQAEAVLQDLTATAARAAAGGGWISGGCADPAE